MRTFKMQGLEAINTSLSYDYVIARLSGAPGQVFGRVKLTPPSPDRKSFKGLNKSLIMIEHPGGGPKMISVKGCEMVREKIEGVELKVFSDFGHHRDTLGGRSGSPVFALDTHELVGLHHSGYEGADEGSNLGGVRQPANSSLVNQAVYIGYIVQDIRLHFSKLAPEILGSAR
jgi:hypothetical protein